MPARRKKLRSHAKLNVPIGCTGPKSKDRGNATKCSITLHWPAWGAGTLTRFVDEVDAILNAASRIR